jgi:UDP-N-acetylmuramoyl-L-alanyl-D-glutamate--2,6-diaminopimelate ligase
VQTPAGAPPARPQRLSARTLAQVADRLGAGVPAGAASDDVVTGITHDSRAVRPGDLYAALAGSRTHGATFSADARDLGAVAVLTDEAGAPAVRAAGLPAYVVADPRRVLGELASWLYGDPSGQLRVLGVTGTNGKTTTAYLLEAGLRATGSATGLIGTIETRIGDDPVPSERTTPEAPDLQALLAVMVERGVDTVPMEVSSQGLALGRVDGTTFAVAVFTNLSEDHLDFHPDLEAYFAAKAELFRPGRAAVAVVNTDDPYGQRLAATVTVPVVSVSPEGRPNADWKVHDRVVTPAGTTFRLDGRGGLSLDAGTALAGEFNVANAALAVVALVQVGTDPEGAARGVAGCTGVPGRMERVSEGQDFLALVDYAHSPDSLQRVLVTAHELAGAGRVSVVIGCGGDRDPYKRPVMGGIAARGADLVVLTNDNPRSEDPLAILAAMREGAELAGAAADVEVIPDRKAAIERAVAWAWPGDVVVVAGKGHEQGQEIRGTVHPFDDRLVLRSAIASARR